MEFQNFFSLLLVNEGSFGINTNILETNLVNQLILAGGLFFVGRDFLSNALTQRQTEIITNVQNSEKRLQEASIRLEEAKKQFSQAKLIMDDIRSETQKTKLVLLEKDYDQTRSEIQRKYSSALSNLKNRERLILADIKQQISLLAIEQVISILKSQTGSEPEQVAYMQNQIRSIQTTAESIT